MRRSRHFLHPFRSQITSLLSTQSRVDGQEDGPTEPVPEPTSVDGKPVPETLAVPQATSQGPAATSDTREAVAEGGAGGGGDGGHDSDKKKRKHDTAGSDGGGKKSKPCPSSTSCFTMYLSPSLHPFIPSLLCFRVQPSRGDDRGEDGAGGRWRGWDQVPHPPSPLPGPSP